MPDELLPCPFCGSDRVELWTHEKNGNETFFVVCLECHISQGYHYERDYAVKYWNTRPGESALTAERNAARKALVDVCQHITRPIPEDMLKPETVSVLDAALQAGKE